MRGFGWLLFYASLATSACAAGPRSAPPRRSEARAELVAVVRSPSIAGDVPPELFVRCDDAGTCPSAVGMLVVDEGESQEPERCTATLIAPDRILTASHCLAASTRHTGAACSRTWIAFPDSKDARAEWVACDRVELAAPLLDESALHQEYAVLRLVRSVARAPLALDGSPPAPGSIVTVASITPHPIYGTTHLLTTRLCRAIGSEPAVAALGAGAAEVGWLAHCPIARGNSGSPVLDYDHKVRAIVHGGTSSSSAFGVTSSFP